MAQASSSSQPMQIAMERERPQMSEPKPRGRQKNKPPVENMVVDEEPKRKASKENIERAQRRVKVKRRKKECRYSLKQAKQDNKYPIC